MALFKSQVVSNFLQSIHQKSELAERLTTYDPYRKLYVALDFNVNPMCAIAAQVKEWDFLHDLKQIRKPVIAQVDEWELWGATTDRMTDMILEDYGDHPSGLVVLGDATGGRADTRSPGKTDCTIIKQKVREAKIPHAQMIPGLVRKRKKKRQNRHDDLVTYLKSAGARHDQRPRGDDDRPGWRPWTRGAAGIEVSQRRPSRLDPGDAVGAGRQDRQGERQAARLAQRRTALALRR